MVVFIWYIAHASVGGPGSYDVFSACSYFLHIFTVCIGLGLFSFLHSLR